MVKATEINFDGLVGPTHHYGGLAHGNVASATNAGSVSHPKKAALQGLAKMKFLHDLGIPQAVLPPHPRPHIETLRSFGFTGSDASIVENVYKVDPELLSHCYSASGMWTANAATISPSADTHDGKLHITPANLVSSLHRSLETGFTTQILKKIFANTDHFTVHDPLPSSPDLSDEGAANHLRLSATHGAEGVEIFVYGREALAEKQSVTRYLPRQTLEASQTVAESHGVKHALYLRQAASTIDAGVFHNDVIAVSNENVLLYHEGAWEEKIPSSRIARLCENVCLLPVPNDALTVEEAVATYFFNSQIVTLPKGGMAIIAPAECEENPRARAALEAITERNDTPIAYVHYLDVRESMRNGGGPACLRLRVVVTEREKAAIHPGILFNDALYRKLADCVTRHYRDSLILADLADPALLTESQAAVEAVLDILRL